MKPKSKDQHLKKIPCFMLSAHLLLWAGFLSVKPFQAKSPAVQRLLTTTQKGLGHSPALLLEARWAAGTFYTILNQHFKARHFCGFRLHRELQDGQQKAEKGLAGKW